MPCQGSPNSNTAYLTGCYDKGLEAVKDQAAILGGVGIGIAFVTVFNKNIYNENYFSNHYYLIEFFSAYGHDFFNGALQYD